MGSLKATATPRFRMESAVATVEVRMQEEKHVAGKLPTDPDRVEAAPPDGEAGDGSASDGRHATHPPTARKVATDNPPPAHEHEYACDWCLPKTCSVAPISVQFTENEYACDWCLAPNKERAPS